MQYFIHHKGSGTIIPLEECDLVSNLSSFAKAEIDQSGIMPNYSDSVMESAIIQIIIIQNGALVLRRIK